MIDINKLREEVRSGLSGIVPTPKERRDMIIFVKNMASTPWESKRAIIDVIERMPFWIWSGGAE